MLLGGVPDIMRRVHLESQKVHLVHWCNNTYLKNTFKFHQELINHFTKTFERKSIEPWRISNLLQGDDEIEAGRSTLFSILNVYQPQNQLSPGGLTIYSRVNECNNIPNMLDAQWRKPVDQSIVFDSIFDHLKSKRSISGGTPLDKWLHFRWCWVGCNWDEVRMEGYIKRRKYTINNCDDFLLPDT